MKVTGTVIDGETGLPMPGAKVVLLDAAGKEQGAATLSNEEGTYTIASAQPGAQVEVSYLGYEAQTIPAGNAAVTLYPATSLANTIPSPGKKSVFSLFDTPGANTKYMKVGIIAAAVILIYVTYVVIKKEQQKGV